MKYFAAILAMSALAACAHSPEVADVPASPGLERADMLALVSLAPAEFEAAWDARRRANVASDETLWKWAAGVVDYPYFHWRETGQTVPADWALRQDATNAVSLTNPAAWESPAFRGYVEAWLHDDAGRRVKQLSGDNRWLKARFDAIGAIEMAPDLRRSIMSQTLSAHVDENGARGIGEEIEELRSAGAAEAELVALQAALSEDEADRAARTAHIYKTWDGVDLYAHVFRPEAASGVTPVTLWFHGGSFEAGHWSYCPHVCAQLLQSGHTVIQIEQRTSQRFDTIPLDMLSDARDAVAWTKANAEALGVDPAMVWVAGFSSGATIAAQLAVGEPMTVAGAIAVSACYDLTQNSWYMRSVSPVADVKTLSPVSALGDNGAPLMIFHAEGDGMCPFEAAARMKAEYEAKGLRVRMQMFEGSHFFVFEGPAPRDALKQGIAEGLAEFGATE